MLTFIAILALVSVPYVLDVYFGSQHDSRSTGEEG